MFHETLENAWCPGLGVLSPSSSDSTDICNVFSVASHILDE